MGRGRLGRKPLPGPVATMSLRTQPVNATERLYWVAPKQSARIAFEPMRKDTGTPRVRVLVPVDDELGPAMDRAVAALGLRSRTALASKLVRRALLERPDIAAQLLAPKVTPDEVQAAIEGL